MFMHSALLKWLIQYRTPTKKKKKNEQQERQANIYAVVIMLNLVWNVPVIVKQEIQPGPAFWLLVITCTSECGFLVYAVAET